MKTMLFSPSYKPKQPLKAFCNPQQTAGPVTYDLGLSILRKRVGWIAVVESVQ